MNGTAKQQRSEEKRTGQTARKQKQAEEQRAGICTGTNKTGSP
jgi:hypothetical protein